MDVPDRHAGAKVSLELNREFDGNRMDQRHRLRESGALSPWPERNNILYRGVVGGIGFAFQICAS